ncbi:MAG: hypothetical protein DRI95_12945 [Bacteroidetes bacterium]|nr:MAG: hypothetical protein DRI95_12945 [Bacteroidota bacterium]RLD84041.1 MAG: hypothetical protein DRJ07_05610 [Bacteroidota bacterium]
MASLNAITGQLGLKNAAHFLRRATFGPTRTTIDEFASKTVTEALADIMQVLPVPDPPVDPKTGEHWLPKPVEDVNSGDDSLFEYFKGWFMEQMRTTGMNITEKMTFFWHAFLPADHTLIMNSTSLYNQNALYRQYAIGNVKELLTKVCVDNAMLKYIDNTLNDKDSPNENFAREFMELYTIGKGPQVGPEDYTNYTEDDVKQAARVLTGVKHNFDFDTIDPDTTLPRGKVTLDGLQASRHDPGQKTFTDKFNNTVIEPDPAMMIDGMATEEGFFDELSSFVDMIYEQEETSKFFCRKLYRFFVYYKITEEIEDDIIAPLAATLRNNNFEVKPVLEQLFSSEHFYDINNSATTEDNIGALIKSPMDLTMGTFRFFNLSMPTDYNDLYHVAYGQGISRLLTNQVMDFYTPIDVAGYPPYHQVPAYNRNWISPNSLAQRYNLSNELINGKENESSVMLYQLDIVEYVENTANISDASNPTTLVKELTDYMFTQTIPQDRFDYFVNDVLLDTLMPEEWTEEWNDYVNGITDDAAVRSQLERLLNSIVQTPEYQLF